MRDRILRACIAAAPPAGSLAGQRARKALRATLFGASFALLFASPARSDVQQFTDGAFPASCWTSTKIIDTTGGGATFVSSTVGAGGNPGAYRDTSHTFGLGAILVAHMNSCAIYYPSAAPIASIDFSYDLIHFTGVSVGGAVGYRLALLQAGTYYQSVNSDIFATSWQTFGSTGQKANAFARVVGPGPLNPDFTCAGGPIQLGFISANSQGGTAPITKHSGLDNWSVTLNLGQVSYRDGTFGPGWVSTKILDTTGGGATFVSSTFASGGNPGAYRDTSHTFGAGAIIVGHFDPANTYDPSTEAVVSIDVSYDLVHITGISVGGAVAYRLGIQQGTAYYGLPNDNIFSTNWTGFSHTGVVASNFALVAGTGPALPDFTTTGTPMTFGFLSSNSQGGPGAITKVSGIDDWSVTLHMLERCPPSPGGPECFCDGSPNNGPCGNNGATGNGCANSANAMGAQLVVTGDPKSEFGGGVGADTVALTVTGMPASTVVIFFKGAPGSLPMPFYSGLLCCGGALKRFGAKSASLGSATFGFPNSSEKVSIAGQSPPGEAACYQAWYRDPTPPCAGKVANLSNSYRIHWK
jgi:hypothetical protein